MEILGIFHDRETAAHAADKLARAGFTEAQLTSLTSVPYPDGVLVKTPQCTWFRWLALGGGLFGMVAGFGLAAGTAWLYPVQTGDKPIIALYPAAIVTFEVAMLCAIIGCMAGMFLEMGLPSLKPRLYDPAITDGYIGISVTFHPGGEVVPCAPPDDCIGGISLLLMSEQRELTEEIMLQAGALRVIGEEKS